MVLEACLIIVTICNAQAIAWLPYGRHNLLLMAVYMVFVCDNNGLGLIKRCS